MSRLSQLSMFFVSAIAASVFMGCATHWDIVRDEKPSPVLVKMNRHVAKVAYVVATEKAKSPGNFVAAVQEQLKQSGAFADVRLFDGITPIDSEDVLVRVAASDRLESSRGEGQSMFDWRMWVDIGATTGWIVFGVENDAFRHSEDLQAFVAVYLAGLLFFPSNYAYVNDSYPYIRYYEASFYRSDGAKFVTYVSRQTARLERQLYRFGDGGGNDELDKQSGGWAGADLVSQLLQDSGTIALISNQQQDLKQIYRSDVFRMMNFQLAMETIRNERSQVHDLLSQESQFRERDIQSTRELHQQIFSGLQQAAQTLQSQSAATAAKTASTTTTGGGPMSNPELQAAAKNCENDPMVLRFTQQAKNTVNISASYCAAAALLRCYKEHGLYGGKTGLTLEQLNSQIQQYEDLAAKYNNNCR